MPKGGKRPGAGRPIKFGVVPRDPAADASVMKGLVVLEPPADIEADDASVWRDLAPIATALGTLSASTVPGFRHLCQVTARSTAIAARIDAEGWTFLKVTIDGSGQEHTEPRKHPLWSVLQNLYLRREYGLRSFKLLPDGKPVTAPTGASVATNAWAKLA